MDLSENGLYAAKKPSKSQGYFFGIHEKHHPRFFGGRLFSDTLFFCGKIQQDEHFLPLSGKAFCLAKPPKLRTSSGLRIFPVFPFWYLKPLLSETIILTYWGSNMYDP